MSRLLIQRGTTFTITINYLKNGSPASLVGATLRFTVKSEEWDDDQPDGTAEIIKNVTSHTDAPGGISQIKILPTDTVAMDPGKFFYDIKVEEAGGDIFTLAHGPFQLEATPTNRQD